MKGVLPVPTCEQSPPRVIPCLLIENRRLVKTVAFKSPKYVGDPLNAVRILNEKQVDELVILDIGARRHAKEPDFPLIESIARECFMPFAYGGGIGTIDHIHRILSMGAEKVVLNTAARANPDLIREAAKVFGSQSVVVSMDVGRNWMRSWRLLDGPTGKLTNCDPLAHVRMVAELGAGEVFLNDVDRDGGRAGYDLKLVTAISAAVRIPLVACGGADNLRDMRAAIAAGASAASAGSMFVLYGKHRAVLITYPSREEIAKELLDVSR